MSEENVTSRSIERVDWLRLLQVVAAYCAFGYVAFGTSILRCFVTLVLAPERSKERGASTFGVFGFDYVDGTLLAAFTFIILLAFVAKAAALRWALVREPSKGSFWPLVGIGVGGVVSTLLSVAVNQVWTYWFTTASTTREVASLMASSSISEYLALLLNLFLLVGFLGAVAVHARRSSG